MNSAATIGAAGNHTVHPNKQWGGEESNFLWISECRSMIASVYGGVWACVCVFACVHWGEIIRNIASVGEAIPTVATTRSVCSMHVMVEEKQSVWRVKVRCKELFGISTLFQFTRPQVLDDRWHDSGKCVAVRLSIGKRARVCDRTIGRNTFIHESNVQKSWMSVCSNARLNHEARRSKWSSNQQLD